MLLRDNIYRAIRSAILTCEIPPGQELREQILAERYHVSRSPIRDSLLRLEYEHLVTVLPRQGYRVNPIAVSDVEDITGLRVLIEPPALPPRRGEMILPLPFLNVFGTIMTLTQFIIPFLTIIAAFTGRWRTCQAIRAWRR